VQNGAYAGRMKEGAFLQTGCLIKWFGVKGMPIHPRIRPINEGLGKELNLDDTFLEFDPGE
jgi:hypothetical protein